MKIEIVLDKEDAILECVNLDDITKGIQETIFHRVFLALELKLYDVKPDMWSETVGYDNDRAYKMFTLMCDEFVMIPKHKKFIEQFDNKAVESTILEDCEENK